MGTTWAVRLVPPAGPDRASFQSASEEEPAAIIALSSHREPTSELARFNAAPPEFRAVSEPFWDLLNLALDLADDTNGAVDPTLGALVDLWGFGPPGPRPDAPSDEAIAAALSVSGWGALRLNREARAVQQPGGLKLDLSGVAKGHAVDRVSERLTALGAVHHLIEIGGALRGAGVRPGGHPWWVELQPAPGTPAPRTAAALFDMAVATSGDRVRRVESGGRIYSHAIDGGTGRPVDNGIASVTVLAETALYADAMATALTVMGRYDGPACAEALNIAAAFVVRTETGLLEIVSRTFAAMAAKGA